MTDPIVDVVIASLRPGAAEPLEIDAAGRDRIDGVLRAAPDALEAVRALITFACFLDVKKSAPSAAAVLIDIAKNARGLLETQGHAFDEVISSADGARERLLGQDRAPLPASGPPPKDAAKWWQLPRP